MTLLFKVGTHPAYPYHVQRLRKAPKPGDKFFLVDKTSHGTRPFRVFLHEVRDTGIGEVYFVELI